jgi:hypothetical protein
LGIHNSHIHNFANKKKSQATWSRELLGKFPEKLSNFEKESYEIVKFFGGFGQISSFLLLKLPYLSSRF